MSRSLTLSNAHCALNTLKTFTELSLTASKPPWQTLSSNNDAPKDSDLPALQDRLNAQQESLRAVETEIDRLTCQRIVLHMNISVSKSILHPIRRYPVEILREIFLHAVQQVEPQTSSFDPSSVPWRLSHVCSRWRRITLDFPQLWTFVRVVLDRKSRGTPVYLKAEMLRIQLSRSGACPISIALLESEDYLGPSPDVIFAMLSHGLSRCKSLDVAIKFRTLRALCPFYPFLRSLESLAFRPGSPVARHVELNSQALSCILKHITNDVTLCASSYIWRIQPPESRFPQVVDIEDVIGVPFSPRDCVAVLRCATSILSGHFNVRSTLSDTPAMIINRKLIALVLHDTDSGGGSTQLLRSLSLPALDRLSIHGAINLDVLHALCQTISYENGGLSSLDLYATRVDSAEGHGLIDVLPSTLRNLSLNLPCKEDIESFVGFLLAEPTFLPNLSCLCLHSEDLASTVLEGVEEMRPKLVHAVVW